MYAKHSGKKMKPLMNILFICSMGMLMVSVAFSWFNNSKKVSVGGDEDSNFSVSAVSNLEVCMVENSTLPETVRIYDLSGNQTEDTWGSRINMSAPTVSFLDITGDGKTLWLPRHLNSEDQVESASVLMNVSDDTSNYISMRLRFRSAAPLEVYLGANSFVSPVEQVSGASSYGRKSLFGNFSCDGIAGAARVAFLRPVYEDDENGDPKEVDQELISIWIPNDKLELKDTDGALSLSEAGVSEKSLNGGKGYGYLDVSGENLVHTYFTEEDYSSGKVMVSSSDSQPLATLNTETGEASVNGTAIPVTVIPQSTDKGESEIIVRIWFEGTDREADMALNGGWVKYNLEFVGKLKEVEEND